MITLKRAIELLTTMKKVCKGLFPPEEQEAVSLGIEALKHIKRGRECKGNYVDNLLSGETE